MTTIEVLKTAVDKVSGSKLQNKTNPARTIEAKVILPSDPTVFQWMKLASTCPSMRFLCDPEEDVYTIDDGEPLK